MSRQIKERLKVLSVIAMIQYFMTQQERCNDLLITLNFFLLMARGHV